MFTLEAYELYRFFHTEDEETQALRGVSINVAEGELVAVIGPSGSGKSTLLSCLAGLDEPDGGYVKLLGKKLTRRSETTRAEMRAIEIGIMLQTANLHDNLTVEENVILKMWLANKINRKRAVELLELVDLTDRSKAYPSQISGGEAARAAIAVALATNPKLLLADEPTGEVDADTEKQILQLFDIYRGSGGSAIIATHSHRLADIADRVVHLHDGKVIDDV